MEFGSIWQQKDAHWYESIVDQMPYIHTMFLDWYKKKNVSSVLEIGCGTGRYYNILQNVDYMGIDISMSAINEALKINPDRFFCKDFLSMNIDKKFDLVFSHSVVDHTPNIEEFFRKSIKISKQFVYHSAYQSISNSSNKHISRYEPSWAIFYNTISISKIKELANEMGCKKVITFSIKHPNPKRQDGTVFIIEK